MYRYIKKFLQLSFCLSVFPFSNAFAQSIYQLRSNSLPDKLQIIVDVDSIPEFKTYTLVQKPVQVVMELNAQAAKNYKNNLSFKQRGVRLVRTGMKDSNTVRLVLEMHRNYRWKAYSVAGDSGQSRPSIIIDVYDRNPALVKQSNRLPMAIPNVVTVSGNNVASRPVINPRSVPDAPSMPAGAADTKLAMTEPVVTTPQATSSLALESFEPFSQSIGLSVKGVAGALPQSLVGKVKPTITTDKSATKELPVKATASTIKSQAAKEEVFDFDNLPTTVDTKANAGLGLRKLVIVIDAGHGGKDSGAIGKDGTQEKRVALQIAKKLKANIDKIPRMRAILTRRSDRYISLRGRLRLARKYKADLFVSIHADAAHNRSARGSSVYILSNRGASSEGARWLAQRENAVDLKYGVDIGDYDEDVSNMIMQIQQDATIESSHRLAKETLQRLRNVGKLHKSYVERAGFAVLKSPDIPSMLVETAFISNPEEEKRLKSNLYQDKLARAIAQGIKSYFAGQLR